ncbi:MAG: DUF4835 family protein [bacterium]
MDFFYFTPVRRWVFILVVFILILNIPIQTVYAQQIKADVKLTLERLPLQKQQKLKDFAEVIETYINDYDWTGELSDEVIPVSIRIFLMDNSVSYEERYSGTFLISNNSDIQYFDKYWRFPYQSGEPVIHNENVFHSFTGFLEFYMYLIIGGEYDKYGRFLGTRFFERAKNISIQAKFDVQFMVGWKEREELVDKILSEENKPFRMMKDLFFLGISYVGEEDSTARKYCSQALSVLDEILEKDPDNDKALQFLQSHHLEYIDLFKDDQDIIEKLIRLDPEHAESYKQYRKD